MYIYIYIYGLLRSVSSSDVKALTSGTKTCSKIWDRDSNIQDHAYDQISKTMRVIKYSKTCVWTNIEDHAYHALKVISKIVPQM